MVGNLTFKKEEDIEDEKTKEILRRAKELANSYFLISNNKIPDSFFVYATHINCAESEKNIAECIDIISENLEKIFKIEIDHGKWTSTPRKGVLLDQVSFAPTKTQKYTVDIIMKFIIVL